MALPKKGSRGIKVNNADYRWMASKNPRNINLIIAPEDNGKKILASFDYNTEKADSTASSNPFIITPYVTREVILFALNNGYSSIQAKADLNLGNISRTLKLDLSGARKVKKLVQDLKTRFESSEINAVQILQVLNETTHFIQHGEWYVGFEIMLSNLDELNFKIESHELILIKEVFEKANVNWKKDWSWIEKMVK